MLGIYAKLSFLQEFVYYHHFPLISYGKNAPEWKWTVLAFDPA